MGGPSGTVTLLFTDVEGSTRAWEAHPAEMDSAIKRHDTLVRAAVESHSGHVFKTVGDAFCAAFARAPDALLAAVEAQKMIAAEAWPDEVPIRIRIALHSGSCVERDGDYFGQPVNRVARLEATAHGGQVVLSGATAALVQGHLPMSITLRDLGEHRLKDLGRPERVFQVCGDGLADDFAPLRSLSNPELETNLPEQASSFVGRDREFAEVRELLDTARLVTLTGPGGSGKTRLALHVAAELVDGTGDGVWLVDLAALADPELVAVQVANVLHVRSDAGTPMLETLVDAVRDRDTLLVLDNCEHVIDAAAKLADALLRSCPRLQLLATSREPLGVAGEHVYAVPTLGVPNLEDDDLEQVATSDSVRLFTERAAQQKAGFRIDATNAKPIARICRRLDGIPLAIELTAARVRSLSPAEIESRLDQRFRLLTGGPRTVLPRQQTLRASIDWSWDLLNSAEQAVLARLGVFAGSWDLAAAEAVVCGDGIETWELLDLLSALVDKSLVGADETAGTVRYRLLETVRSYSNEKLEERAHDERVAAQNAHRDHYLALAGRAAPELLSFGQAEWLDRLDLEHDNLRTALSYSLTDRDPQPGLRLAVALWRFWLFRGYAVEGVEALTTLLDRPDTQTRDLARGRALVTLAGLLTDIDNEDVEARSEEALEIARARKDDPLAADALSMLSWVRYRRRDLPRALEFADMGLAVARRLRDSYLTARLLNNRALTLSELEDVAGAEADYQEACDLFRATGNGVQAGLILSNLAYSQLTAGDLVAARANLTAALADSRTSHDDRSHAFAAFNLGLVELVDGNVTKARDLFVNTMKTARRIGDAASVADALLGLGLTTVPTEAERAATIHGAAAAERTRLGISLEQLEADMRDADLARLRDVLGADAFDARYQAGGGLSRDAAITLALG